MLYNDILREVKRFQQESSEIKSEALEVLDVAHAECENKIANVQTEANRICEQLRQESLLMQNENEILIGKLQAVVESHSECLKKCEKVFEDQEESIHNVVKDSVKKYEYFEDNDIQIKDTQDKLEEKSNKKFEDIESKVSDIGERTENFESSFAKVNFAISKNLMITTAVPLIGLFCLCFWVHILTVTLPNTIFQETNPSFEDLYTKLDYLSKGMKTKVDGLETETLSELGLTKKNISSLDKSLKNRFDSFVTKFEKQIKMVEEKIESYEDSVDVFDNEVGALREDLSEQFTNFQSGIIEQFTEASIRYNEFMIPKIWISKATLKDEEGKGRTIEGMNLGLYREDGKERSKPVYKQVDGFFKLFFSVDNKWVIVSLDRSEEEEVIIQANPKVPELSTDKWKLPTHKVNVVHEIPCCKTLVMKHKDLTHDGKYLLGALVRGGRGVWQSKQGGTIYFSIKDSSWLVRIETNNITCIHFLFR